MNNHAAVFLDASDLAVLVDLSEITPSMGSPLLEVVARGGGGNELGSRSELADAGWIEPDGSVRLTGDAHATMLSLLRPTVSGRSVLGTRREVGTLGLYAADPGGPYVAMSASMEDDSYLITPDRTFADLSNAVTGQVLLGPMEASVGFGASLDPEEFATMAAVFDWRTRTMLRATLDRDPLPDVQFNATELWEMLVEGRTTNDPAWAVTLFGSLVSQVDFALSEDAVATALERFSDDGLVNTTEEGWWRCSPRLEELAESLQPFGSYAGLHLEIWDGDEPIEAAHLAFVRGPFALVVMRPMVDDGQRSVTVDAITDIELADLLTELAVTPSAVGAGAAKPVCPHCGAQVEGDQKFCATCGEGLGAVGPTGAPACPSCGAEVDLNKGAFCSQCGAPVAVAPNDGGAS